MKSITREKSVLGIAMGADGEELLEKVFHSLSDDIYGLTRGLYRYKLWGSYGSIVELETEDLFLEFDLHTPIREREVDEIWIFASRLPEKSMMGGANAFWIGESPVQGTENIHRKFPVMRFSTGSPLAPMARRMENIMYHVYRGYPPRKNMWEQFIRNDVSHPRNASCGSLLYPPNGHLMGYTAGDVRFLTDAEDWLDYPNFRGVYDLISSDAWGNTQEGFLRWWFKHIPHGIHKTDGVHDNWWHYFMNLDLVR